MWEIIIIGVIIFFIFIFIKNKSRKKQVKTTKNLSFNLKSNTMSSTKQSLTIYQMKSKPIFKEFTLDTGHPETFTDNLVEKIEDLGYIVKRTGSVITKDDVMEDVKDYRETIESTRSHIKKEHGKNANIRRKLGIGLLIASVIFFIIPIIVIMNLGEMNGETVIGFLIIAGIAFIIGIVLFLFRKQTKKEQDKIWIKINGKIYSGTKTREIKQLSKDKTGQTKGATSIYVYSEMKIQLAADSEMDINNVKEDIKNISEYLS